MSLLTTRGLTTIQQGRPEGPVSMASPATQTSLCRSSVSYPGLCWATQLLSGQPSFHAGLACSPHLQCVCCPQHASNVHTFTNSPAWAPREGKPGHLSLPTLATLPASPLQGSEGQNHSGPPKGTGGSPGGCAFSPALCPQLCPQATVKFSSGHTCPRKSHDLQAPNT